MLVNTIIHFHIIFYYGTKMFIESDVLATGVERVPVTDPGGVVIRPYPPK